MADTTKLTIELDVILRNLQRTLRGLNQIEQRLRRVANVRIGAGATGSVDRQSLAAQRFALQQQRLATQTQELANRQERARQSAERLRVSQDRLAQSQQRLTQISRGLNIQQDRHVQTFRAMERASQSFNRSMAALGNSLRSVGQGLASFGATLTFSVSAPLAALAFNVVDAAVRMDSLRRGLTTIAGSSEQAAIQLERLTEIAKLPGIGFEEAIQGSIALQAVGFSAADAEKALVQFSNAVALTGGSREQLQTITVQLGQMAAQSKVLAADLKPIINAAPAVAVALRNAFGTVRSEEIQELGIQSKDFIDIMIKELGKLPRATAGARNSFDNFRDTIFRASAVIGESLLPALVRLADVVGPIATALAEAFAALPAPIQSTLLVIGALTIALGPLTFIFGQLITGLGRVLVGFAQLNTLGLLPTIANFHLLGQVMIGTASLAQGAAATAAAAAVGWAALAGAVIGVVALIAAIATLSAATEEHKESLDSQVKSTENSIKVLREQYDLILGIRTGVAQVGNEQRELDKIYNSLNRESQTRVLLLQRELGFTRALQFEIGELIEARQREQEIQAALTVTALNNAARQVTALKQQRDTVIQNVQVLRRQREALLRTGDIVSPEGVSRLEQLNQRIKDLSAGLPDLAKQIQEANEEMSKQDALLQRLEESTGKSTREILQLAQSFGLFPGNVDEATKGVEAFRDAQIKLEAALTNTTEEVIRQRLEMRKLSAPADLAQQQRRQQIDAAIATVREQANTIDEARQKLDEYIKKFPEVGEAIKTELKKAPLEEFLRLETGRKRTGRAGSEASLRNARQQLADAIAQVALAQKEQEVEIELDKNAALQRAAEVGQRLRIFSYREYLELRARLTTESLDSEIIKQKQLVAATQVAQARLLKAAQESGIPSAERVRRQAQATQAQEEQIRAETRLTILQNQRGRVQSELNQELKLAQDQQLKDTIQLEIQFAELQGKIQAAMEVAAVEEFREALEDLSKAQDFLNKQIKTAQDLRQTERVQALQQEQQRNQRQIETINNTIRARIALAELAAAEKLVENAKERQRQLEADLAFQVQFRGLSEEESIRRRLEGEQRLQASMELSRQIVQDLQRQLAALGITPPPEFQKFIDGLNRELLGLGELTFVEQFRLVEKEFQRLNDERLRRIQDVERAVNNRTISEAEGLLFIRRINGEYVGDLERQLELLKQIAKDSKEASLVRQAQAAEETVKDAGDRLADFNKQLRSTSIDALRDGFIEFFQSLRDNTITAQEKLLNLIDSVVARINEVIAESLFDELIKSLFGDGTEGEGVIAGLKRLFGFGGDGTEAIIGEGATHLGSVAQEHAAATVLQAGATTAAATFTTGVTASATTFGTSVITAATSFAALIVSAGAAFAAAVGVGGATGAASGSLGSLLSGSLLGGGAAGATGLFPAVPGGVYRVVEGGYPEAVMTTDPKHYTRQWEILKAYLKETRGLGGRIKSFAMGAIISPSEAIVGGMSQPSLPSSDVGSMVVAGAPSEMRVRQVLVDQRSYRDWLMSSEGEEVVVDILQKNQPIIRRLGGRK